MVGRFGAIPLVTLLLAAQAPTIRVDTHLVEVNVIVRDQNNRQVEGLTKADFAIFDRGKEQRIAVFSADSVHHVQKPAVPLPATRVSSTLSPVSISVVLTVTVPPESAARPERVPPATR